MSRRKTQTLGSPTPDGESPSTAHEQLLRPGDDVVAQQEHADDVVRFRWLLTFGLAAWVLTGLLDWFVASSGVGQHLASLLAVRAMAAIAGLVCLRRLRRSPLPTVRLLRLMDFFIMMLATTVVSIMCVWCGGLTSPYFAGVILVLGGRGSVIADPWRRGIVNVGVPALAYPATMLVSALIDGQIRAQFASPQARAIFVQASFFIFFAAGVITLGGHGLYHLRRKIYEARKVGGYRLKRCIGVGGMGEVWTAHHQGLRRDVAIKMLRGVQVPLNIARFEREFLATARLNHPNTVRVLDFGVTDDSIFYYAMELLEGETLQACVKRTGQFELPAAIRITRQIAGALDEAHGLGIVHRDIKPSNIFLTTIGSQPDFVKVIDFGVANVSRQLLDSDLTLTKTGMIVGTPDYMSPEAVSGGDIDIRADIYALGAVLFFMLAGRPPFQGTSVAMLLDKQLREAAPRVSAWAKQPIPPPIEDVISRCLEKDPARRFQTAAELAAALSTDAG